MRKAFLIILALMLLVGNCYAQDSQKDKTSLKERIQKRHAGFNEKVQAEKDTFDNRVQREYDRFRRSVNEKYARFLEQAWKSYGIEKPIPMPKSRKLEPVQYDKEKEQKMLLAKKKQLQEEQNLLNEKRKEQEIQQQKLADRERQQQEAQQKLTEEQKKLDEARKQLENERQKFLEQQGLQQKQAEEQEKILSEQLQQLEEKKLQQEAEQKRLDEEKDRQKQQQQLFNNEREKKEAEQKELLAVKDQQQKESLQKILEEQKKLDEAKKQLEAERQELITEQKKQQDLAVEKEKAFAEQSRQLQEQQRIQDEEKNRLAESSKNDAQQKEAQRKLSEDQKKLQEAKKQLEKEQKQLLADKKQQQKLSEQKEKQLSVKQQQLEANIKKQEEQKAKLDEEQKKQDQQRKLLAEEQKRKEKELQQQFNEQNKKLQEEQQRLAAEKKKLEDERNQFLAEKQKQQDELQKSSEAKKKELELQQKQLDETVKQQMAQQKQLDEEKKQQEQQKRLLAEEKSKQQEQQKEIDKQKKELEEGKEIKAELVVVKEDTKPQPKPIRPVGENDLAVTKNKFMFYGTPMEVRWGNASNFKLAGTDSKSISQAYLELTDSGYDNLLHDCLEIRQKEDLCDWAYYKMLQDMAETACGKGTNEAVLLQGVLYQQSGYMMRFALDSEKKLHILSRVDGTVYDHTYWCIEDNKGTRLFYLLDGSKPSTLKLDISDVPYPDNEQVMNFSIPVLPKLNTVLSDDRLFYSGEPKMAINASVNKNMIDFFNDYPASCRDNDATTRWPYYANAPLTKEVKENLYDKLRPYIANTSKLMAANILLAWVQHSLALAYAIDERVWGTDRAFFAEETLYYPQCDCEDHAILYSYLVRDLLKLDVVLMYHPAEPQHMYTAVCFGDEDVKGDNAMDYVMVNGKKFVIADPTCENAPVGHTMNAIDNKISKVIPLKKL